MLYGLFYPQGHMIPNSVTREGVDMYARQLAINNMHLLQILVPGQYHIMGPRHPDVVHFLSYLILEVHNPPYTATLYQMPVDDQVAISDNASPFVRFDRGRTTQIPRDTDIIIATSQSRGLIDPSKHTAKLYGIIIFMPLDLTY